MHISTRQLIEAKELAAELLEQLGLETYVFGVEPRDGRFEVRVERALADGWQTVTLSIDPEQLARSRTDEAVRAALLRDWRERLAAPR
ncbi:MAG TPA: hypothetical protein VF203_12055 [Burkholderiales bacterium]